MTPHSSRIATSCHLVVCTGKVSHLISISSSNAYTSSKLRAVLLEALLALELPPNMFMAK
jgi:hypothetical protein